MLQGRRSRFQPRLRAKCPKQSQDKAISAKSLVQLANEQRSDGNLLEAVRSLRRASAKVLRLAHGGVSDASSERPGPWARVAAYELALLLSQRGRHGEADRLLSALGFRHKLNPSVFDGSCSAKGCGEDETAAAFDGVLPNDLLKRLRLAFASDSVFWKEHGYPTPGFFSYNEPLATEDGSSLLQEVASHLTPLAREAFPKLLNDGGVRISSLEWWAHRRDGSAAGHQLHYDLDEAGLAMVPPGTEPGHPLVSCVLFMSTSGAPTLVTDQGLAHGSVASRAWLCEPAINRVLLFNGGLLHGVVPGSASAASRHPSSAAEVRLTIMIGLWGDKPSPTLTEYPRNGGTFGPNMRLQKADLRSGSWPSLFEADRKTEAAATVPAVKPARANLRGPITPAWTPILQRTATTAMSTGDADTVQFLGRWFLDHDPSRLQEMIVTEARGGIRASPEKTAADACSGVCTLPPDDEVEEVSMDELLRMREGAEASTARHVDTDDVEEVSMEELLRMRVDAEASTARRQGGKRRRVARSSGKKLV